MKKYVALYRFKWVPNIKNFINMIILICGKLKFNYHLKTA